MDEILEGARAMRYEVGSNLRRGAPGAPWTLLLPSLELDAALTIGAPPPGEKATLEALFGAMVALKDVRSPMEQVAGSLRGRRLDLLRIGSGGLELLSARPEVARWVEERLEAATCAYRACASASEPPGASVVASPLRLSGPRLALGMLRGEPRAWFPAHDAATRRWLAGRGWQLDDHRRRGLRGLLARWRRPARWVHHAHLEARDEEAVTGPPHYVAEVATADGWSIEGSRWALLAPGDYATQKVLLLLFGAHADDPHTIVKLAGDPAHARRLMTEADALRRLAALDLPQGRVPALRFAGTHAGRGVVGEDWLAGRPFREAASGAADSPELGAAVEWLHGLAAATVARRPASEVAEALQDLFARFVETYRPAEDEREFLAVQLERIAAHGGDLPVVAQHGDPGAWNLMVDAEGRVLFLDWESAETAGLPLWDLLYFLRSYGALTSRLSGVRGRVEAATRHLLTETPLQARFAAEIARMADSLALPGAMVEPLFYACWMHRALKEATRRRPARLESAHYRQLLRHLIRHRQAPGLHRLLQVGAR